MSATLSILGRCVVAAASQAIAKRMVAAAVASAVAVAGPAQAEEYIYPDGVQQGVSSDGPSGKLVGGVVGAGAGALAAIGLGASKYIAAAAAVLGGIGGAKIGERMSAGESLTARTIGEVVPPGQMTGYEAPVHMHDQMAERSMFFPSDGLPGQPRMSAQTVSQFDGLAIAAAAYRLLVQVSSSDYALARERLALAPRDVEASRHLLASKRNLEADIAGLNIALADYSNAMNVLRSRYPGNNFGPYQALAVSLSAPASVRAREIEPDRPIYPFAEAMAMQIKSGTLERVTAAAPGYATGGELLRSAIGRQDAMAMSGRSSAASPDESLRRMGMGGHR
jgi:hypothetical protein